MSELQRLLHDPVFHRLGLTLVHFLWQGLALALLALALRGLLRRAAPALRYLVLLGLFVTMAAAPVLTFTLWTKAPPPAVMTMAEVQSFFAAAARQRPTPIPALEPVRPFRRGLLARAGEGLRTLWWRVRQRLPVAGLLWMLGVLALSLRLLLQWGLFARVARRARPLAEEQWQRLLASLCARLGVRSAVRLLQSVEVGMPTAAGWLRPVILLPPAVLLGLTPDQLEAVIAHELAHIRRHDFLVNVFQRVVEVLLFYHPAVWWVSGLVRLERELCCDDLAVTVCGDRVAYARALEELESRRGSTPPPTLSVARGPVLERVLRLLFPPEEGRRPPSWSTVLFPTLALTAITVTTGLVPVGTRLWVPGALAYAEVERRITYSRGEVGGDTARVRSGRSEWVIRDAAPFHSIEYSPRGDEVLFAQATDDCPPGRGEGEWASKRPPAVWKAKLDVLGRPDLAHAVNLVRRAGMGRGDAERARWSPDGSQVLMEFIPCGCKLPREEAERWCERAELWVMNADGSDAHQIRLPGRRMYAGHVPTEWTPDGGGILLFADEKRLRGHGATGGCFLADADGGSLRELPVSRGAVSPDGEWIVGARDDPPFSVGHTDPWPGEEDPCSRLTPERYRWEVVLLHQDGTGEHTVLSKSYRRADLGEAACGPAQVFAPRDFAWSPDGSQFAFVAAMDWDPKGPSVDKQVELYIYDLPSGHLIQVTHDNIEQRTPVWME